MKLFESYLIFLEQNAAWARAIRSGKLKPSTIEKLKKAGIVKPWEKYEKGMEKGFQNIIKKTGSKLQHDNPSIRGGKKELVKLSSDFPAFYNPRTKTIHIYKGKGSEKGAGKDTAIIKKHEASEAEAAAGKN